MPAATGVPINPKVLAWAIEESGFSSEEIAKKVNVAPGLMSDWLSGERGPTAAQLRRVAEKLDRPTAFFFRQTTPPLDPVVVTFRAAIGHQGREPTAKEREWIRKAQRIQDLTSRVSSQIESGLATVPELGAEQSPERAAERARAALGISVATQLAWESETDGFNAWVAAIEAQRVAVFRLPMGRHAIRGFALWNEWAPAIGINTAYRWTPQRSFTLLHEYGHLARRHTAVDLEGIPLARTGRSPDDESWCNRFAAAVMMPEDALRDVMTVRIGWFTGRKITELDQVAILSDSFKSSLRATDLRLIQLGMADRSLYDLVEERAVPLDYASLPRRSKQSRRRPRVRIRPFGRNVSETLISGMDLGVVSEIDLIRNLDIGLDELTALQEALTAE